MAIVADCVLKDLLKTFPAKYCYAFAYGSAVFAQNNQQPGKMTDLVFVVDDPLAWHTANLEMNRGHYSGIKLFGPQFITSLQERMACGVYYNPYCTIDGKVVKYGVVSRASIEDDLKNWSHIYIAGRLHKPVVDLCPPAHASLAQSVKKNRQTALRTALLQKGRFMSKFELFHNIAEISYLGDTRMRFAETPDKTRNIVAPLMREFDLIYSPLLNEIPSLAVTSDGSIAQDISPMARYKNLIALPIPIQISLVRACFKDPRFVDVEQCLADLSYLPHLNFFIRKAISEVVRRSSLKQTVQGIFSAGVGRSILYALEKLRKGVLKKKEKPVVPFVPPSPLNITEAKEQLLPPPPSPQPKKSKSAVSPSKPTPISSNSKNLHTYNDSLSSALSSVVPGASAESDPDDGDAVESSVTNNFKSLEHFAMQRSSSNDNLSEVGKLNEDEIHSPPSSSNNTENKSENDKEATPR